MLTSSKKRDEMRKKLDESGLRYIEHSLMCSDHEAFSILYDADETKKIMEYFMENFTNGVD